MVSLAANITSPPADWLPNVMDPAIQEWATRLYEIWGDLGRQVGAVCHAFVPRRFRCTSCAPWWGK